MSRLQVSTTSGAELEVPGVLILLLLQPRDLLSCFSFQAHFFQISAGSLKIYLSTRMLETLTFQFTKSGGFAESTVSKL